MSEVTIGASLPIRTTLQDLLCSGDAVHEIVGLMSVSASDILTDICDFGYSFSEAVSRTFSKGLFEDDAFQDLDGTEAALKLLVLLRELGLASRLTDVEIEPLARRRSVTTWVDLSTTFVEEDRLYAHRVQAAKAKSCTLRYVQRIQCIPPIEVGRKYKGEIKASVRLEEVPLDSAYARVKGPLYYFSFHTERYAQNPLVIQGPLSDSANTASGMLGDILRIAKSLGAKDKGPLDLSLADEEIL